MFFNREYKVERRTTKRNEYGEEEDSTVDFSIMASLQPLNREEKRIIMKDGSGAWENDYFKMYTAPSVILKTEADKGATDYVIYDGKKLKVLYVDKFIGGVMMHNRYILRSDSDAEE